ncbi:EexN family lipoprotein [Campylobacter jejuni]|nr:EexN family lipoprotein [Campylobacter jejuni]
MRRLSILLTILIVINITACDSKTENYYKNHPSEAKEKAKECKESGILSEDCINTLKKSIIIPPITETPSEIYPSKTKDNNQSSIFSDDVNITQEKLP